MLFGLRVDLTESKFQSLLHPGLDVLSRANVRFECDFANRTRWRVLKLSYCKPRRANGLFDRAAARALP